MKKRYKNIMIRTVIVVAIFIDMALCQIASSSCMIQASTAYDYDFTVEKQVRVVGAEDQTWKDAVDAKIGDKVEFRIQYKNTSDVRQTGVTIKDTLPSNLRFVPGSIYLKNATFPSYSRTDGDSLVTNGLNIGNYGPGANAYIKFTAEIVDEELAYGKNTLISWAQAGVGDDTHCASASVILHKSDSSAKIILMLLTVIKILCLVFIIILIWKIIKFCHDSILENHKKNKYPK